MKMNTNEHDMGTTVHKSSQVLGKKWRKCVVGLSLREEGSGRKNKHPIELNNKKKSRALR